MSRSGYTDDCENLAMWRGQVASAIRGKRGQLFCRELLEALDSMPDKRLIQGDLVDESGCMCTLGVAAAKKGIDPASLDTYDYDEMGKKLNIAHQLAQEVMFMNDEGSWRHDSPGDRWHRMRRWVAQQIQVRPDELIDAVELV